MFVIVLVGCGDLVVVLVTMLVVCLVVMSMLVTMGMITLVGMTVFMRVDMGMLFLLLIVHHVNGVGVDDPH